MHHGMCEGFQRRLRGGIRQRRNGRDRAIRPIIGYLPRFLRDRMRGERGYSGGKRIVTR